METFRYETGGTWYKGGCHTHSVASDGGKTREELARIYADGGYDFLVRSDHWDASAAELDTGQYPLLWMDGIELDGRDYTGAPFHVLCLGSFEAITREMGFVAAMESARAQGGILILAHPHWTGNSLSDALRWGFDGVEVYNHVCRVQHDKGSGAVHWSAMLKRNPNTLAFAVDDAHILPKAPTWGGGWVMVNAAEGSREAILAAIRAGNFYSTCGPEFNTIECDGTSVSVVTSPVQYVRLVGPAYSLRFLGSFDGQLREEATLEVPGDWPYAFLEIEDEKGRRAWTNPLFIAGS